MKNNITTKEELNSIQNIKQAFQGKILALPINIPFVINDIIKQTSIDASENEMSSIRTPKRLLFQTKRTKKLDLTKRSKKAKDSGGSIFKQKSRKRTKKSKKEKTPIVHSDVDLDGSLNNELHFFKKDLIKVKDYDLKDNCKLFFICKK